MNTVRPLLDHPVVLLLFSFGLLWLAMRLGAVLQARHGPLDDDRRGDFDMVLGATLTLLSLIVAFSFSMASSRYDKRILCEAEEANAIGTAYARAELLPAGDAKKVQGLLREYTDLRVRSYTTTGASALHDLDRATEQSQAQLWRAVSSAASAAPSPMTALAVASMNDAINSQAYAQAADWDRIPLGAWVLVYVLGAIASAMTGYRFRLEARRQRLKLVLPGVVATAFFLIADIDCPKHGVIRVAPQNLQAVSASIA